MTTELPTIEQVLAAIDNHPQSDYSMPSGQKLVSWRNLAYTLFPKNSPLWRRPKGMPHGQDQSPAYEFMSQLGKNPEIRVVNTRQTSFYGWKDQSS